MPRPIACVSSWAISDLGKEYWDNSFEDGRQSIPYKAFKEKAFLIKEGYIPRLNFLKVVDEVYLNTTTDINSSVENKD